MGTRRTIAGAAVLLAGALAVTEAGAYDVSVYVEVPENLADAAEAMPELQVFNNGDHAIEFEAFHGVPFTFLEEKQGGEFVRPSSVSCGNGYAPRRIAAGGWESFPLWSRLDHGPGVSGTYRVALPYVVIAANKRIHVEALGAPFELRYGDVPPAGWHESWSAGELVFEGIQSEAVDEAGTSSHSPQELFVAVGAGLELCVEEAQKTLPWLRGSFSLVVYRYPGPDAPVTYVDSSLLGDDELESCMEAVPVPEGYTGRATLHMAVSHPHP
jgi:hypothetical protein